MLQLVNEIAALRRDEKGVTAIEYGLIIALITLALVGGIDTFSGSLSTTFTTLSNKFSGAANGNPNSPAVPASK